MSRRASLPGASELFRRTSSPALDQAPPPDSGSPARGEQNGNGTAGSGGNGDRKLAAGDRGRSGSPRQKHDAKITVYVSGDELLAMEHARLTLRGSHDLVVDRGRLVREAVAVMLADFDQNGDESVLVERLRSGGVGSDGASG